MRPLSRLLALLTFSPLLPLLGQSLPDQSVFLTHQMAPKYQAVADELRRAAPKQCDFDKAQLGDVLRFLAKDAGINFINLPEDSPESTRIVSFSIQASPFTVLETLCKAHTLALIPDGEMWYIRPAADRELVSKGYEIKFNAMERVERNQNADASASAQGIGTIATSSIDLQGARETYKTSPSQLINHVRAILDLPKEEDDSSSRQLTTLSSGNDKEDKKLDVTNELSQTHRPKVLWQSDANMLYVVGTRLQHMWVEGYLAVADKPQPLIAIEVKFVETSRDPTKEFGLDWGGVFGQNGTYREVQGYDQDGRLEFELKPNTEGGLRTDAALLLGDSKSISGNPTNPIPNTLRTLARNFNYPWFGVLASQDLTMRLRAMLNDEATTTTSYPRMVTLNNREVAIKSVINTPVLSSTGIVGGGTGAAAAVQSVSYLPIGTVLNILPKKMQNGDVNLNVGVTVSSIIGEQLINGNKYPVATSRVYNAPVEMPSGYTVAIGGLDEARERQSDSGVPLLAKIPGIKYLFSSKSRAKNHKTLMLFITSTLIDAKDGGLPDEPQSVLRQRPDAELPKKPATDVTGNLVGGPDKLPESISYLNRELDKIDATINEARATAAESKKLTDMKLALNQLDAQVEKYLAQSPERATELTERSAQIQAMHDRVGSMKRTMLKKSYY